MDLAEQVAGGTHRQALEAIRDRLAVELVDAEGRDVAALTRELRATLLELEGLPTKREESPVDNLAEQRAKRRRAANQ